MKADQRQQPLRRQQRESDQSFSNQRQGHQSFGPGCDGIGQGDELRQHASSQANRQQRDNPGHRAAQADEGNRQEEQKMIGAEKRMADPAQQSLPGCQACAVTHAEGMVGVCWGRE